jgi:hypothetical protein
LSLLGCDAPKQVKIPNETLTPVEEPSLDGLKVRDPIFGKGLHLDWFPILEGVKNDTLVSYYSTEDWGYLMMKKRSIANGSRVLRVVVSASWENGRPS